MRSHASDVVAVHVQLIDASGVLEVHAQPIERITTAPRVARCSFSIAIIALLMPHAWSQCPLWNPAAGMNGGLDGGATGIVALADAGGPALYAGGGFLHAGGLASRRVARWDGTQWSALPGGPDDLVFCLCAFVDRSGPALYAGGQFTHAGGITANAIAKWDGTNWMALTSGLTTPFIQTNANAMCVYDDGSGPALFVAGSFDYAGIQLANNVAKWNGTTWEALGGGVTGGGPPEVWALTVYDDGTAPVLAVGGFFDHAGSVPANGLAFWHGPTATWTAPPAANDGTIRALAAFDDGHGPALFVGGNFQTIGGVSASCIARYDGAWSSVNGGVSDLTFPHVDCLRAFDDGGGAKLYVGGKFTQAGSHAAHAIARWDGTDWSAVGQGTPGTVAAIGTYQDPVTGTEDLYVGGLFNSIGGLLAANIGAWHGCVEPANAYCFGDGTIAACPCANSGAAGRGCENSASTGGALLTASGATYPDTMVLRTSGELANALTVFLQGDQSINPVSFGDGLRCAAGHLKRLYIKNAMSGSASGPDTGESPITIRSLDLGDPIQPATARYYQAYYRDPNMSFCPSPTGNTWNVTNAIRILW
jgi:hypothetical protein